MAHGYVKPLQVDDQVGLLVVGEGMRGRQGLAGRIFTAISREQVNIIAIAQGSSELTIAIVVRREGWKRPSARCTPNAAWASRASRPALADTR